LGVGKSASSSSTFVPGLNSPAYSSTCQRRGGPLPLPTTLGGWSDSAKHPEDASSVLAAVMDLAKYLRQELVWLHRRMDEANQHANAATTTTGQLCADIRLEIANSERREDQRRKDFHKNFRMELERTLNCLLEKEMRALRNELCQGGVAKPVSVPHTSIEQAEQFSDSTTTGNDLEHQLHQQQQQQQQQRQQQQRQLPLTATVLQSAAKPLIEEARRSPLQRSRSDSDSVLSLDSANSIYSRHVHTAECHDDLQPAVDLPQARLKIAAFLSSGLHRRSMLGELSPDFSPTRSAAARAHLTSVSVPAPAAVASAAAPTMASQRSVQRQPWVRAPPAPVTYVTSSSVTIPATCGSPTTSIRRCGSPQSTVGW